MGYGRWGADGGGAVAGHGAARGGRGADGAGAGRLGLHYYKMIMGRRRSAPERPGPDEPPRSGRRGDHPLYLPDRRPLVAEAALTRARRLERLPSEATEAMPPSGAREFFVTVLVTSG